MPELSEDEKKELQSKVADADMLHEMIALPGWTKVLQPKLAGLKQKLINEMLTTRLDYNGFLLAQQSVNAVDSIMAGIEIALAEGEEAREQLKEE